ncbi:MAG: hypothetical protein KDC27_03450, partial [Acidobacteria bacterium]|nr:hypothetical protein [Acidobacteriota bacterium]
PLTALAVGLDPRESRPALFAGTAGEGLLIVSEDGRMELVRAEEQAARDIEALLPLSDGRLLIGTQQRGVVRYDAAGMGPLDDALAGGHVVALAGEPEEIWIATLDDGLIRYHGGAIERIDDHSGLPDKRLLSLAVQGERVFAGTAVGVAELVDGKLARTPADGFFASALAASDSTLYVGTLEEGIAAVALDRARPGALERPAAQGPSDVRQLAELDQTLYAVTPEALWRREADGDWRVAVEPAGGLRDRNISALRVDPGGRVWAGYFDKGLDIWDGTGVAASVEDDVIYCVNRLAWDDERATMAVATANGLAFLDAAGGVKQVLRRADGLMADHVTDFVFRPGGWVAATPAGLTFFDAGGMRGLYALHGLVNNHVYTLGAQGQTLLTGTLGGLSVLENGVVRKSYTTANSGLRHNWISALAEFRGDWYVGTYGAGVVRLRPDGRLETFEDMDGVEVNPNAMAVSGSRVYAGTLDRGLLVYDADSDRWSFATQGFPSPNVTALAYQAETLYIGTDNSLARITEKDLSFK